MRLEGSYSSRRGRTTRRRSRRLPIGACVVLDLSAGSRGRRRRRLAANLVARLVIGSRHGCRQGHQLIFGPAPAWLRRAARLFDLARCEERRLGPRARDRRLRVAFAAKGCDAAGSGDPQNDSCALCRNLAKGLSAFCLRGRGRCLAPLIGDRVLRGRGRRAMMPRVSGAPIAPDLRTPCGRRAARHSRRATASRARPTPPSAARRRGAVWAAGDVAEALLEMECRARRLQQGRLQPFDDDLRRPSGLQIPRFQRWTLPAHSACRCGRRSEGRRLLLCCRVRRRHRRLSVIRFKVVVGSGPDLQRA